MLFHIPQARGATLFRSMTLRAQRDTFISPATDVCPTSQPTRQAVSSHAFRCALSGPFDKLPTTRISATRTLCARSLAVTSASTVCACRACCLTSTAYFARIQAIVNALEGPESKGQKVRRISRKESVKEPSKVKRRRAESKGALHEKQVNQIP